MSIASREFADDPCSSLKRGNMVRAARNLLSAVTRLLILADMVDVHCLLKSLRMVENDLERLRNAANEREVVETFRAFGKNASHLIHQAARRQVEMKDRRLRDDLAAARAVLKKHSMLLLTASKVQIMLTQNRFNQNSVSYWLYEIGFQFQPFSTSINDKSRMLRSKNRESAVR